jgi:hypothetical protein
MKETCFSHNFGQFYELKYLPFFTVVTDFTGKFDIFYHFTGKFGTQ